LPLARLNGRKAALLGSGSLGKLGYVEGHNGGAAILAAKNATTAEMVSAAATIAVATSWSSPGG